MPHPPLELQLSNPSTRLDTESVKPLKQHGDIVQEHSSYCKVVNSMQDKKRVKKRDCQTVVT